MTTESKLSAALSAQDAPQKQNPESFNTAGGLSNARGAATTAEPQASDLRKSICAALNDFTIEDGTITQFNAAVDAVVAALAAPQAQDELAYIAACNLAKDIYSQHYREGSEDWKVLPDLRGVISQISNMVAGMTRRGAAPQAQPSTTEPIYQVKFAGQGNAWHDASEAAYHTFIEKHRRIVYSAPAQPSTIPLAGHADLLPHLRQFMHNDGSGFVAGYDKAGIDREFSYLRAKAAPEFETVDDLIEWLDTLHATEGGAITNQKWEPAQKAIAALRAQAAQPCADTAAPATCEWRKDTWECDTWDSQCGERWSFIDGGPAENSMKFCHGCGKPLSLAPEAPEDDEDGIAAIAAQPTTQGEKA